MFLVVVVGTISCVFMLWGKLYASSVISSLSTRQGILLKSFTIHTGGQIKRQRKDQRRMRYRDVYHHRPPEPRLGGRDTAPSEICGASPEFTTYFGKDFHNRSVNDEDQTIYNLVSKDKLRSLGSSGRYIELGAFNGVQESNTRFFDECLGWTGLLIEGNPVKYEELMKNRPHAHRMSFAPSCSAEEEKQNKTLKFHGVKWTNAGLVDHAMAYKEKRTTVLEVPCGSLTPVIQDVLGGRVHLFSLDVEGSEPTIVENINFTEVQIDMLMIESSNVHCPQEPQECQSRTRVREIMEKAGYKRCANLVLRSDLYIHPKSELQLSGEAIRRCRSNCFRRQYNASASP